MPPRKKSPPAASASAPAQAAAGVPAGFPIVGIGASAGGLEAYTHLFKSVPASARVAIVLVQHLDPSHPSLLGEILGKGMALPIAEAQDGVKVESGHVYVIPPNRDMRIREGRLHLNAPTEAQGRRMAINTFFAALAEDQGANAIGVILSGSGTDGTEGCRALLARGGYTFAQDPVEAGYADMPRSVIDAGLARGVLSAEAIGRVLAGTDPFPQPRERAEPAGLEQKEVSDESDLHAILARVRMLTSHDFSQYKRSTIVRRIERRMAQLQLESLGAYLSCLIDHPAEAQGLLKDLLINVTEFFRDTEAFAVLKDQVLPGMLADKPDDYVIRAWVAGCASGEEAYSLAITLREHMDQSGKDFRIQLYATDLDDDAIASARRGKFPVSIARELTPERLHRYFVAEDGHYRIKKEIRDMVVFAVHDVLKDPPFTRLDLLFCRNLMIYLEPALQQRLIPAFHYALKPGGVLMLSPSESIGVHAELFAVVHRKWKLYRALQIAGERSPELGPSSVWTAHSSIQPVPEPMKKNKELNIAELTRRMLLQDYVPASVVTDTAGNILYIHGDTGDYLRPAPGQATLNIVDMAREGLQMELGAALREGAPGAEPAPERNAVIKGSAGVQHISFSIRPLLGSGLDDHLLLISFKPRQLAPGTGRKSKGTAPADDSERVQALERELAYTRSNLQTTIEELQSTNEELKSTNEELQSTNEELQSSNEELETSREELQSVNEELVTVNTELQAKIEQLGDMQNDMKNLLDNIHVGTIFLDSKLAIRRFTRDATQIYRLIASDAGRPLADITSHVGATDLLARAQQVLDSLIPYEGELTTGTGNWFQARIQPYRTLDNVIDGVVLTFHDITQRIANEQAAHAAHELSEAIVATVSEPLLVLDSGLRVVLASRSYCRDFATSVARMQGASLYALGDGLWNIAELRAGMGRILETDSGFDGLAVRVSVPGKGTRTLTLNARRVLGAVGRPQQILLAISGATT